MFIHTYLRLKNRLWVGICYSQNPANPLNPLKQAHRCAAQEHLKFKSPPGAGNTAVRWAIAIDSVKSALALELLDSFLHETYDRQMLRADAFALAASDAV